MQTPVASPELQLRVGGHVSHGELARAALDILGLGGVPCWSVRCRHGVVVEGNVEKGEERRAVCGGRLTSRGTGARRTLVRFL